MDFRRASDPENLPQRGTRFPRLRITLPRAYRRNGDAVGASEFLCLFVAKLDRRVSLCPREVTLERFPVMETPALGLCRRVARRDAKMREMQFGFSRPSRRQRERHDRIVAFGPVARAPRLH